jgi:hypothetical protein
MRWENLTDHDGPAAPRRRAPADRTLPARAGAAPPEPVQLSLL